MCRCTRLSRNSCWRGSNKRPTQRKRILSFCPLKHRAGFLSLPPSLLLTICALPPRLQGFRYRMATASACTISGTRFQVGW